MLTGKYRRIYYYHLKKCGGSTLNQWLDTLTFDERCNDPTWTGTWLYGERETHATAAQTAMDATWIKPMFHWSDVIHSHASLLPYVPPRTFSFTMLRDPVQRLVSQVYDWRRLTAADTTASLPHIRACVEDCRTLPMRDFLQRYAYGDAKAFLNNHLTRALAAGRLGRIVLDVSDASRMLDFALRSLEEDYDFVGLTEHFHLSRNALCCLLGLPPAQIIPTVNKSRQGNEADEEILAAADILEDLTHADRALYDKACHLFEQRHLKAAEAYGSAAFETLHAGSVLDELRGTLVDGATRFSVRSPIIGSGFHGRDGARSPACVTWTGPGCSTTLYMPAPSGIPLSVLVWIKGYATARLRDQLRVRIDGKVTPHRFEYVDEYADLLIAETIGARDFLRLDLEIDETVESGTPGSESYDPRKRGFAFDGYGWRRNLAASWSRAVCPSLAAG